MVQSEEDLHLKEELTMLVERLQENNKSLYKPAFESLRTLIKSATTSMTSVPKPLKFLRPFYGTLKAVYEKLTTKEHKSLCADIISILGITMSETPEYKYDSLNFRLLGSDGDVGSWGHEYVRHLTSQIVGMWNQNDLAGTGLSEENQSLRDSYLDLANRIIPYLMNHNAEAEAVDLCLELEELDIINEYTIESNYERVCLYMTSCVPYLPEPDNYKVLRHATTIYTKFNDLGNAMRFALRLNDPDLTLKIYNDSKEPSDDAKKYLSNTNSIQRQLAYLLGKQQFLTPYDEAINSEDTDLPEMLGNTKLSEHFLSLGRELDIMEPKIPEDIYKSHLETVRPLNAASMDTMRSNLSASYVNGLVNCGFGKEKLLQEDSKEVSWVYKQKDFGKMSTVATLGWVMLWDVECGLTQIDKYFYTNDDYSRAGALLGCGVVNCGVKNECDPALALLSGYVDSGTDALSRGSIIGLGVAYAGSMKAEAIAKLLPIVSDTSQPKIQKSCLAALSCGMIAVGSLNVEVTSTIIQTMLDRPASHWNNTFSKFMALGLALTCLGRQEDVDVILASLEVVAEPLKSMAHMMCDFCAYAGSGNVLKVQNLLHILSEKYEKESSKEDSKPKKDKKDKSDDSKGVSTRSKKKASTVSKSSEEAMDTSGSDGKTGEEEESSFDFLPHQGLAAIGVAVLSMGEEIGLDMAFRMFGHLLRFGELPIKRAVPLALGLCYISNPQLKVLDTLSKFSHDSDSELAYNSILALGLVGAGTNNARLAAMLRQLAVYHIRDAQSLFLVRLAQGLVHLGKGTLTLSPWHSDRTLLRPVALAGLLTLLVSCLDTKSTFMGRHDYLIFYITPAIQPRLLMTFDEDLKPLPVTVRVGQAVDVVGQAGRPKTLTGFQTHTTPVLLSHGERAELATEEYIPVTKLPLESFVILAKNPNFDGTTH